MVGGMAELWITGRRDDDWINLGTAGLVQVRLSLDNKIQRVSREAAKGAKQEELTLAKAQRSQRKKRGL